MFKKIQIVGNVGKDPEIKHLQGGAQAANFGVACNESWTDSQGEKQSRVTWFNVVAYQAGDKGLVSNLIKPYLRQGQLVFIDADPTLRKWVDQNGNDRLSFEIKLGPQSTIRMLGGRKNGKATRDPEDGFDGRHRDPRPDAMAGASAEPPPRADDSDIPF